MDKLYFSQSIIRSCGFITAIIFSIISESSSSMCFPTSICPLVPNGEEIAIPEKVEYGNWRTDTIHIGDYYVILQLPDETVTYINDHIQDTHCPIMIMFRNDSIIDFNSNIFFLNCLCGEPNGKDRNAEKVYENESVHIYRTTINAYLYRYFAIHQRSPFQIITSDLSTDKARLAEKILQRITILENQSYRIDNHYPMFKIRQPENM